MMIQPILANAAPVAAKAGNEAAQMYGFTGALQYLTGFIFVIGTLILLWLLTALLGSLFIAKDKKQKAAKAIEDAKKQQVEAEEEARRQKIAATAAVAAMTTPVKPTTNPQLVAVITAAAQTALSDETFHILSIKSANSQGWSAEGRRAIFDGRRVRK